jgi:hypothetical protein
MLRQRSFAARRVNHAGKTGEVACRAHFDASMDTRTKLIITALILIVLTFIVISGALAFTGPPSN